MPTERAVKCLSAAIYFCCLSFIDFAAACDRAAGVVPFSKHDGEILILIADHRITKRRGWAAFGGCIGNDESIAAGALRELHEETRCALAQSIAISRETPKVSFGKFTSFAVEVPFISAKLVENNISPKHCRGTVFRERGPWAWVELSALLSQINLPSDGNFVFSDEFLPQAKRPWLWGKSARVIKALHELRAFQ